jgi:hypothetical protein
MCFNCNNVKTDIPGVFIMQQIFHKKCVPNHNKMHIPEEEEEDSCVCHMISVCI